MADPKQTARALDLADGRESLHAFCGLIEVPGAPIEDDADSERVMFSPVPGPPAKHHHLLIDKLEAVERGDIRRLMVFMPPGSAKSTYASVAFPCWFMGRSRRRNVIVATYASDLARKIGRRARSIIKQPVFREMFDVGISSDSFAADEWALDNENEFMGGGILSGITGNRADCLIIDDPIKGRQEADSETIRRRTREEYQDSLKTRLKPGGRIVLIQTRWHEDDLAGSILPDTYDGECGPILCRDGEVWEVISIPAEANREDDPLGRRVGEMLWPEWFDETHWRAFRSNPRTWAALYQQRPQPEDGTYFIRDWFGRWSNDDPDTALPSNLHHYLTSDHAQTEDGDWTVFRIWGLAADGDVFLVGGFRVRATLDVIVERAVELIRRYKPFAWFPENDTTWRNMAPFVTAALRKANQGIRIEPLGTSGDKISKARGFQGLAAQGRVWLPDTQEGDEILDEYLRFPAGKHDDEVDAAALIGRALDEAHPAIAPHHTEPEVKKRYETKRRKGSAWAA